MKIESFLKKVVRSSSRKNVITKYIIKSIIFRKLSFFEDFI